MVQLPHKVKGNVKKSRPQYGLEQLNSEDEACDSDRIFDIDETVRDCETFRQVLTQRLHPEAFRRMMTGREVVYAALACDMHGLFSDF